jgi:hypothetical protein
MLGGEFAVLQAPMFDGLSLDPFTLFNDCLCPAEVGIGGRHVVEALVIAAVCRFALRSDPGFSSRSDPGGSYVPPCGA